MSFPMIISKSPLPRPIVPPRAGPVSLPGHGGLEAILVLCHHVRTSRSDETASAVCATRNDMLCTLPPSPEGMRSRP
jgi:hypothetical protein